jgi:hypothetical protein
MFGFARVTVRSDGIAVRFERVGDRQKFNLIMERFNASFPLKEWDLKKRAWFLPSSDLERLITFCDHTFGTKGYLIEKDVITV